MVIENCEVACIDNKVGVDVVGGGVAKGAGWGFHERMGWPALISNWRFIDAWVLGEV